MDVYSSLQAYTDTLVCKQTAFCYFLNALEHHDEKLDDLFSGDIVHFAADLGHDDLDHPTQHVLLVFDAFAITNRVRDCLLEHVADWQKHLEQSLMRAQAAVLS